jgi:hypothetical protein
VRRVIGWIAGVVLVGACQAGPSTEDTATADPTGTSTDTGVEVADYPSDRAPLLTTQTQGGLEVALWLDEAGPARGTNAGWLRVEAAGAPVDGLSLAVVPLMPSMGHGTHVTPVVTPRGEGYYRVEEILFTMAGPWELRVEITGSRTDEAVFALHVP